MYTKEEEKNAAKKRRFERRRERKQHCTWDTPNADLIAAAICAVSKMGGAIRFGLTRDGGAYAIGIYGDGEPYTEYIPPDEDINAFLEEICIEFNTRNGTSAE